MNDSVPNDLRPRRQPMQPWERRAPRGEMIRTGIAVGIGVAVIGVGLFTFVDLDFAARKERQKVSRAIEEMARTRAAIERIIAQDGEPPLAVDGALPEEFAERHARLEGGAPFHREVGRLARLDLFSPDRPHAQPLAYASGDGGWVLLSRGPDEAFDASQELDAAVRADAARDFLARWTYDPTNGTGSGGDLWVGRLKADD